VLSINVPRHAARQHPEEYAKCLPHIEAVVNKPFFIGDDHKNHNKIELIARVPALGSGLLVAVTIEPGGHNFAHW